MLSAAHHSTSAAGMLCTQHARDAGPAATGTATVVLQLLLLLLVLQLVSMVQQRGAAGSQLVLPLAALVRSSVHAALAMQRAAAVAAAVAVVGVPDVQLAVCATVRTQRVLKQQVCTLVVAALAQHL
jgi:2-methylaconitate cis-trans-isomerase PrpF